jgi:dihydroorotate dehydrogenase (fumarate)
MSSQQATSTPPSKFAITISPPLLNSSNPWATTYDDLKSLYDNPYTGAVTIRTSLWSEFQQDPTLHQVSHPTFSKILGAVL